MRLLSWNVLGSEWIALLIIAFSVVTLVAVTCVIGFPRFAISVRELLVRLKENSHLIVNSVISFWQRFLRTLYSLGEAIFIGLHGERWSCPTFGCRCCGEPHRSTTLCDRLLQVYSLDDSVT